MEFFHSNIEGEVINRLYAEFDARSVQGIIFNPSGTLNHVHLFPPSHSLRLHVRLSCAQPGAEPGQWRWQDSHRAHSILLCAELTGCRLRFTSRNQLPEERSVRSVDSFGAMMLTQFI